MAINVNPDIAQLPNVKRIFIPDPGWTIYDADLSGADAQVVAWEADDAELKELFKSGRNVHEHNAETMFGDVWRNAPGHPKQLGTKKGQLYYDCKRAVHATNYIASARTLAITLGWSIHEAEDFQRRWFKRHPGIRDWQERVKSDLRDTHTVKNICGFRRVYFDRPDSILPEAIAWIPQSTIAITCRRGAANLVCAANDEELNILLQTHDSLTFQMKNTDFPDPATTIPLLKRWLANPLPYPDPLTIQWKLTLSKKSWGDCEEWKNGASK
jgi:DNA polymerase I-like protein with 3'-5' exonuclease and polymerase domains